MSAPAIKICGLTTPETLEATIAARADYAGFNFCPVSPRFLALDQARALTRQAEGRIVRVGVFLDPGDAELAECVKAAGLDAIQLHGSESPERVAEVRLRHGLPVWKVISIAARGDLERAGRYREAVDRLLLDAKTPRGAEMPGGMGVRFDWSLLRGWQAPLPWGLAGGLDPANVAEAVALTAAPLVDVSSGIEASKGIKDPALIARFCEAARSR
jgi:phosphoribosylanthranilate isomerase